MGGGHASELEDGGNRIEGGYTFRAEESAHGIERRLGMEFGSGAQGKKRTTNVAYNSYYIIFFE